MRKLSLILAICFAVISAPTMAQNVTYACQYVATGGLVWKDQQWQISKFIFNQPFFLSASNSNLNVDSVAKALGNYNFKVLCHEPLTNGVQACINFTGNSLIFDFNTMNGGISKIIGSTQPKNEHLKDTISVEAFTCTKM